MGYAGGRLELDGIGADCEHGEGEGDLGKHFVDVTALVSFKENKL